MILRLGNFKSDILPERVKEIIGASKYAFNPSFIKSSGKSALTIRLFNDQTQKIEASLFIWTTHEDVTTINLTSKFKRDESIDNVADPKLFLLDGEIWGTFNTGHQDKGNNEIYLFKFSDFGISNLSKCFFDKRNRIEKNWGFYKIKDELFALYSLNPFTILKAKPITDNTVHFQKFHEDSNLKFSNYTLGSPLYKMNDTFCFIAHKKYYWQGKRLYTGKAFSFSPTSTTIKAHKKILIHNFISLLGAKKKFNRNLISCTYFSGIYFSEGKFYLSYGINDVDWNIVSVNKRSICP